MGSFISCRSSDLKPSSSVEETDSAVIVLHTKESWDAHWHAHKESNKLMVIDFSASWCGPCRMIEPTLKAFAAKYTNEVFVKIDVDELPVVSKQWGIQAMPTFVLVKGGEEVCRVVGAEKDELERKVLQFKS